MCKWISVDGVESSGKTTLVNALHAGRPDWTVLSGFSRTPLGGLLDAGFRRDPYVFQSPPSAQAMMVLADFVIRWNNEILPELSSGSTVLTDRGWLSKLVYQVAIVEAGQNGAEALGPRFVASVMSSVPSPWFTVVLLPDVATVEERLTRKGVVLNAERRAMLRRISTLFTESACLVQNSLLVDGVQPPDELAVKIYAALAAIPGS